MKEIKFDELMGMLRSLTDEYKRENNDVMRKRNRKFGELGSSLGRWEGVVRVIKEVREMYECSDRM